MFVCFQVLLLPRIAAGTIQIAAPKVICIFLDIAAMPFTFKQFNPLRRYSQVKFESVSDSEALLSSDSGDEKQVRRYHKYTKFGVYGVIVCLYTVAIFLVGSFTLKTEKACPYDDMTYCE